MNSASGYIFVVILVIIDEETPILILLQDYFFVSLSFFQFSFFSPVVGIISTKAASMAIPVSMMPEILWESWKRLMKRNENSKTKTMHLAHPLLI